MIRARVVIIVAIVAIVVGVALRLANVEHKIYYQDEAVTSLRVAGHTLAELSSLFDGRVRPVTDVQQLLRADEQHGIADTVRSLASEDPQHPPLYYMLAVAWMRVFGASPVAMRLLPVAASLLALPLMYALCIELFGSLTTARLGVALMAVSPFHVLYAYQAREYSLLTVMVLAASLVLLRALRVGSLGAWIAYAVCAACGLYTYLLFADVMVGHAVFVMLVHRLRVTRAAPFLAAAGAAAIAAIPWFILVLRNRSAMGEDLSWAATPYPLAFMLAKWVFFTGATFFDLEYSDRRYILILIPVLLLIAYSIIGIVRFAQRRAALFVLTLTATTGLCLAVPDLFLHQHFSTNARYLTPTWLGFELAVAFALGRAIDAMPVRRRNGRLALIAAGGLIAIGAWAGARSSIAASWWENNGDAPLPAIAAILNARAPARIESQWRNYAPLLALTYLLPPGVQVQAFDNDTVPLIRLRSRSVYLFSPSTSLRERIERTQRLRARVVYDSRREGAAVVRDFRTAAATSSQAALGEWGEGSLWLLSRS